MILNGKTPEEKAEFEKVQDYFTLNLDESNFLASEGNVKILGLLARRSMRKRI